MNDPSSDYKVDVFSPKMTTLSKKTSGFCSEDGYVRNIFLQFWKMTHTWRGQKFDPILGFLRIKIFREGTYTRHYVTIWMF